MSPHPSTSALRIKQFALSIFILIVLVAAARTFPASAQGDVARIIQLASTGQGRAHAVAYSPDENILAVGSSLGIHLFNSSDLQPSRFVPTETWVRALAFSPGGSLLASGSYDSTVRLWSVKDGTLSKKLTGHTGWVRGLAFSPDSSLLATASDDNTVRLWRIADGTTVHIFAQGTEGVKTVDFSPDGTLLATGGYDKTIRLWRIGDGSLLRELKGHTDWVRALVFSPDGNLLASGGFDATVRLWRVADGQLLVTREEHASSVLSLAFSPDGTLLASASVDESVRLWQIPNVQPYALLKGHTDFVFDVAFSPNGRSLASSAVDNTVRVWAVPAEASSSAQEIVPSPSDCRVCHHPRGQLGPPRVIETECKVCHQQGALALNWCTLFMRSPGETTPSIQPQSTEHLYFFPKNSSASVEFFSPGNGEVVYGRAGVEFPLEVHGRVFYTGDLKDITLKLEVRSDDKVAAKLTTTPLPDGSFKFIVGGNEFGSLPFSIAHSSINIDSKCFACHVDSYSGYLPDQGAVHLQVTMTTPDGLQTFDNRLIYVDHGRSATIPVQLLLEDSRSVSGVLVQATTRLYEWRGRTFKAVSDSKGKAALQVEVHAQIPTVYQISVAPLVVDGILYESVEPVQVSLPSGATSAPIVTIRVRARSGQINGQVIGLRDPLQLWMIQLPTGSAHTVTTSPQGTFSFTGLPVSQYLLISDLQALVVQGLTLAPQQIDLSQSPSAAVELTTKPLKGASLHGNVSDEDGAPLPFAWASVGTQSQQTAPASGAYGLGGLLTDRATAVVSAPGYYSQAHVADAASINFRLVRRPETHLLSWGSGTVVLPPETVAHANGHIITFEQGWLWGEGEAQEPLLLQVNGARIAIPSGRFALERLPAQATWFYLFEGTARIQPSEGKTPIEMRAGQMVRIKAGEAIQIVGYDPVVAQALRSVQGAPVSPLWQPSLEWQIRNRLALVGVSAAQAVTFITYSLVILAAVGLPFLGLYLLGKRRLDL